MTQNVFRISMHLKTLLTKAEPLTALMFICKNNLHWTREAIRSCTKYCF